MSFNVEAQAAQDEDGTLASCWCSRKFSLAEKKKSLDRQGRSWKEINSRVWNFVNKVTNLSDLCGLVWVNYLSNSLIVTRQTERDGLWLSPQCGDDVCWWMRLVSMVTDWKTSSVGWRQSQAKITFLVYIFHSTQPTPLHIHTHFNPFLSTPGYQDGGMSGYRS